jgi:hypothetical protein
MSPMEIVVFEGSKELFGQVLLGVEFATPQEATLKDPEPDLEKPAVGDGGRAAFFHIRTEQRFQTSFMV